MTRGTFIVIEGADGTGKTTQAKMLADWWARTSPGGCIYTAEPSKGQIGLMLRQMLQGNDDPMRSAEIALMFAADRLEHIRTEVYPALVSGRNVVCDRYVLSNLVYQGLHDRGLLPFLREINHFAMQPDATIWLDAPWSVAMARIRKRAGSTEAFDDGRTQAAVHQRYATCAPLVHVVRVDASADTVTTHVDIITALAERGIGPK